LFPDISNKNYRHLILLRHGEAEGSPDIERQLTPQGFSQSRSVAKTLTSLDIMPDFVLCSDVLRTRQTLSEMSLSKDIPTVLCGLDLYRASSHRDFLNIIAEYIPPNSVRPLIIGHNPTIHETVLHLSKENRGDKFSKIEMSYPSGTASVFEFKSDDWDLLHPSTCRLTHIISSL